MAVQQAGQWTGALPMILVIGYIVGVLWLLTLAGRQQPPATSEDSLRRNLFGVIGGLGIALLGALMMLARPLTPILLVVAGYPIVIGVVIALWYGVPEIGTNLRGVERGDSFDLMDDGTLRGLYWAAVILAIGLTLWLEFR
jgi:hypothetical protein